MAIKLPQKPRPGYHSINELVRAVNGVIDFLSSLSIAGKAPVKVSETMFGYEIGFDADAEESGEKYSGYFKVIIKDGECHIVNGGNEKDSYAGYAYYNAVSVHCPKGEISPREGFLCLQITKDSSPSVEYVFKDSVPDMPVLESSEEDNSAWYPLAFVSKSSGKWKAQQLAYGLPQLWCFGPCDEEEE
ncbi:MAG: hypothetical protein J6A21_09765 [Lentisphaeria bacterium]|nr:hypothetical protein [Lentisphaeria bacterium]